MIKELKDISDMVELVRSWRQWESKRLDEIITSFRTTALDELHDVVDSMRRTADSLKSRADDLDIIISNKK